MNGKTPMSTSSKQQAKVVDTPLTMRELAEVLVKHYGLHEGLFDLSVEFQIGTGLVGPKESQGPGALVGVSRVGLVHSTGDSPMTVDAAIINPQVKKISKRSK